MVSGLGVRMSADVRVSAGGRGLMVARRWFGDPRSFGWFRARASARVWMSAWARAAWGAGRGLPSVLPGGGAVRRSPQIRGTPASTLPTAS